MSTGQVLWAIAIVVILGARFLYGGAFRLGHRRLLRQKEPGEPSATPCS